MTMTKSRPGLELLTYEAYMAEGTTEGGYDIVEGVRIEMAAPSWKHQRRVINILDALRIYEKAHRSGLALIAPFDILLRRYPRLQTRQPDVFFITNRRLESGGGIPENGPIKVPPELIVEVISDSESRLRVEDKLRDYHTLGVDECWRVWSETRTVELLQWKPDGYETAANFNETQSVQSIIFNDLSVPVSSIFAD